MTELSVSRREYIETITKSITTGSILATLTLANRAAAAGTEIPATPTPQATSTQAEIQRNNDPGLLGGLLAVVGALSLPMGIYLFNRKIFVSNTKSK